CAAGRWVAMRLAAAALLAAVVALAAIVVEEVGGFVPPEPPAPPRAQAVSAPTGPPSIPGHTSGGVGTILTRPLFSPDRRPAMENTAAGERTLQGLPRLSGIMVGPFGRSAIFVPEGRKPLVVAEGGRIDAWTIQQIDAGGVRVSGPGGTR